MAWIKCCFDCARKFKNALYYEKHLREDHHLQRDDAFTARRNAEEKRRRLYEEKAGKGEG